MLLHRSSYWVLLVHGALFCIIWHNPSESFHKGLLPSTSRRTHPYTPQYHQCGVFQTLTLYLSDSGLLFQRSTIPKVRYSESLLFPLTLSLTRRRSEVGYPDLNNMTYLSRLAMMLLSCFSHFLCGRFGLGLGSGLGRQTKTTCI